MTTKSKEGKEQAGLSEKFKSRYLPLYMMLIPIVLYYAIFVFKPMAGLVIAFQDYNVFKGILSLRRVI